MKSIKGVKKVFVTAGLRYDLILKDKNREEYLLEILNEHTSGQLKIAPEHTNEEILRLMGKPSTKTLVDFLKLFETINKKISKKKFLTYYFIAAHPGCTLKNMIELKKFISKNVKIIPEQVQIFTPVPSTYSTLMYYTEINPFNGKPIFVEKDIKKAERQKNTIHSDRGIRSHGNKDKKSE